MAAHVACLHHAQAQNAAVNCVENVVGFHSGGCVGNKVFLRQLTSDYQIITGHSGYTPC